MVLNHIAGEKMFVDFAGDKLSYVDKETGEIIATIISSQLPVENWFDIIENETIADAILD